MNKEEILTQFSEEELLCIIDWANAYFARYHTGSAYLKNGAAPQFHRDLVWKIERFRNGETPSGSSPTERIINGNIKAIPDLPESDLDETKEYGYRMDEEGYIHGWYVDGYIVGGIEEVNDEYISLEKWCPVHPDTVTAAWEGLE